MNRKILFAGIALTALSGIGEVIPMRAVAHRGLWNDKVAENTVEAIRRAYAAGAECVETDFHEEKNGDMMCYHDLGRVAWVKARYPDYRMPTLEEVLAVVPKDREIQAEIKTYGPGYAEKFVKAVRAAGLSATNVTVSSFDYAALKDFKARHPEFPALWLVDLKKKAVPCAQLIADAKAAKLDVICPGCVSTFGTFSPKDADAIRAAGMDFRVYGVNTPSQFRRAIQLGASGFTSDRYLETRVWAAAKMPRRGFCAHRGDRAACPENTPAAIRTAIEKGAEMVEFDLQRCKTGEIVVMHDLTVNRTTDGKGHVMEMTFDELRKLDAGVKAGEQFRGTKVPTLDEMLAVIPKEGVWINFHCYYADNRCIAEEVAEKLTKEGRLHQGVIAALEPHIEEARAKWPDVITCDMSRPGGYASGWPQERITAYVDTSVSNRCDSLQFFRSGTAADFEYARRNGLTVNYFDEDDPARCRRLFADGVDFILVNDIDAQRNAALTNDVAAATKAAEIKSAELPAGWPSTLSLASSCNPRAVEEAMSVVAREVAAAGGKFVTVPDFEREIVPIVAEPIARARTAGLQGTGYADRRRADKVSVLPKNWRDWSLFDRLQAKAQAGVGGATAEAPSPRLVADAKAKIAERCIVLLENDGVLPLKDAEAAVRVDITAEAGLQAELNKVSSAKAAGKKVVAVVFAKRPTDLSLLKGRVDALLFAGDLGDGGETAVARVLKGEANPSGRIVTPGMGYPVGYGLGYLDFAYSNVKTDRGTFGAWSARKVHSRETEIVVSADVTNCGKADGCEAVECFVQDRLVALSSVALKAGETKTVSFGLPAFAFGSTRGVPMRKNGELEYAIRVGGSPSCTNRLTAILRGMPFADDFEGPLDTNVWSRLGPGRSPWNKHMSTRPDLIEMRDGCLVLVGTVNADTNADPRPYLTGGVWNQKGPANTKMTYGRVEIRAKFEDAKGAWPAFWMLTDVKDAQGRGWPWSGEIDIVERLNADPFVHQTAHTGWTYSKGRAGAPRQGGKGAIRQGEFNVYGLERTPTALIWSVNGVETFRYEKTDCGDADQWPFTTPFYFLLDMQLGGNWVGEIDPKTLPVRTWIDWIRVYTDPPKRPTPRKFVAAEQKSGVVGVYYDYPNRKPVSQWLWVAKGDPNVRAEDRGLFGVPDECKPIDGGKFILMNDSCGGFAGLDVMTGLCAFYGNAGGNPHSVARLPDGRIAVASSTGRTLKLFDVKEHPFEPEKQKVVTALDLPGGHGVVWDEKRNSLFALGYTNLYELAYSSETMSVTVKKRWDYVAACRDAWGHDLLADGQGGYYFTNHSGVWRFDPATEKFTLGRDVRNVKAFSPSKSGDLLTVPNESWWTDTLLVLPSGSSDLRQARTIVLPGARFYKARWL